MTTLATHIPMRPLQRKRGLLVVVKYRWFPGLAVMTGNARCDSFFCKLLTVNFHMTGFALRRRSLEIHAHHVVPGVRGSMAVAAFHDLVSAAQRI